MSQLKKSPAYRQGWNDASVLIKSGLSVWALCSLSAAWGFRRKPKGSHKKLTRYCDGFNDRIQKRAKSLGIKLKYSQWHAAEFADQNDIGREADGAVDKRPKTERSRR